MRVYVDICTKLDVRRLNGAMCVPAGMFSFYINWLSPFGGRSAVQFLQRPNVGIVVIVERRAISRACRSTTLEKKPKRFRPRLARSTTDQLENEGSDGNARTISVSIHIISSEFQGGGSGNGEA